MGMTVDALRIQQKGESFEREIPMDEIGSIFRGKTKSTRDYVFQGMKVAGIGTMGFGMLMGMAMGSGGVTGGVHKVLGMQGRGVGPSLLLGAIIVGFYSIFTVPAGALIGYMRAKVAEGKAVEYVIGEGNWTIVTP